jgi:hypothetical protein
MSIVTSAGILVYLIHGTADPGINVGDPVTYNEAIYHSDGNQSCWGGSILGAHLHFEVHLSLDFSHGGLWDDINPEQWLAGNICTSASHSIAPPSPQVLGTVITLLEGASGCPNPYYQFMIQRPGQSWSVLRGYSGTASIQWDSTNQTPGDYGFGVWVHDSTNPDSSTFDANAGSRYTFTPSCPTVTPVPSPASPQNVDTQVTIYGTNTGCSMPEYKFFTRPSTSTVWTVLKDWTPYNSPYYYLAGWFTAGLVGTRTYYLGVWVRQHGTQGAYYDPASGDRYDAANSVPFTLNPDPCTAGSAWMSAYPPSPHTGGISVIFSGGATCPHPSPLYEFWMLYNGTWTVEQPWGTQDWWSWNSNGAPAGTYSFGVWVRDSSSLGVYIQGSDGYDTYAALSYTVT